MSRRATPKAKAKAKAKSTIDDLLESTSEEPLTRQASGECSTRDPVSIRPTLSKKHGSVSLESKAVKFVASASGEGRRVVKVERHGIVTTPPGGPKSTGVTNFLSGPRVSTAAHRAQKASVLGGAMDDQRYKSALAPRRGGPRAGIDAQQLEDLNKRLDKQRREMMAGQDADLNALLLDELAIPTGPDCGNIPMGTLYVEQMSEGEEEEEKKEEDEKVVPDSRRHLADRRKFVREEMRKTSKILLGVDSHSPGIPDGRFVMQFPWRLPRNSLGTSSIHLRDLIGGQIGELRVYESGRVTIALNSMEEGEEPIELEANPGTEVVSYQELAVFDVKDQAITFLGSIDKMAIFTPSVD